MIDFSPIWNKEKKYIDLWRDNQLTVDDLRRASNASVDWMLDLIAELNDHDITFDPADPNASDPDAVAGEETIGWNLAHLIAHVTSSSEEGAAFSSLLARGVEGVEHRPRYETPWRDLTTQAQVVARLQESRRMRIAFLESWPDQPDYHNLRVAKSERFQEYFGDLNAPACFLMGLGHELGHYEQMSEVKRQALAARK